MPRVLSSAIAPQRIPNGRWFHIIVPIMILCIVSYMDRTAISFAIPGGMSKDLAMSASFAGFAAGIFFIGYLLLQVPGGYLASRGIAKRFLTWSMVSWGIISIATASITNETQLIALRFLLGVAEGGMLPVVLTMISKWFPDKERGRAMAITIMFVPIANIISGPISGLVIQNIPLLGLALSLLLSVVFKHQIWLSFSCLVLAGAFLQGAAPVFWTIPPLLFTVSVAGSARGAINALGNLGGFFGPFMLGALKDVFGSTDYGVLALVAFLVISAIVTVTLPNTEKK
jgi:sugar phosphate permease